MSHVKRLRGGGVSIQLNATEAELLRQLLEEMTVLLEADIPRVDPVIGRLFPQAYVDPSEDDAYRTMVGDDLQEAKRDALRAVKEAVGDEGAVTAVATSTDVGSWLTLITDLRLAIGTRLDVTEERMAAELDSEDADAPAYSVLHWLGWLQESLLREIEPSWEDV